MTLLLPEEHAGTEPAPALTRPVTWPQRAVALAARLWQPAPDRGRRGFMRRAALIGTALAVNPWDFILRPMSAYASVCGPSNECNQGWTAFCCTVNGGANTCPDGSYAAGWWKVSSSAFCRGEDRYVIDCNRLPQSSCSCRCADGECDRRRVCCNNFRYGQCNQQIPGTTEVVCRIIICTPPWEWDDTCTTTVRTDERTRDHSASCLNGPDPTEIDIIYQDLGLVGSILGVPISAETDGPDGGSWRAYTNGAIVRSPNFGITVLAGAAGLVYTELDGPDGALGYVTGDPTDVEGGQVIPTDAGAIYVSPDGPAFAVYGPLEADYSGRGGPAGWLGFPISGVLAAPGGRQRLDLTAGWSLVYDPSTEEVRLVPVDVEVPSEPGEWFDTATVARWDGPTRIATAVAISVQSHPDGADMAVLAGADSFADALSGGVLAGIRGGPVLLTGGDALAPETAAELARLNVQRVVLVGGALVLGAQVESDVAVAAPGTTVQRLAGDNRFATAAAVAGRIIGEAPAPVVYVTSGRDFPDALAASPAAAGDGAPLLLTEPHEVPLATRLELNRLQPERVVIVGGSAAVSEEVAIQIGNITGASLTRLQGASRYDTAAAVVTTTTPGPVDAAFIATGETFADALAAGAAAAKLGAPLLLVSSQAVPLVSRRVIQALQPQTLVMVGGLAALDDVVTQQLTAIPTGPYTPRGDDGPVDPLPDPDPSPSPQPNVSPSAEPTAPQPTPEPTSDAPGPVQPPTDP